MITFNNFHLTANNPSANITIPRGSIVYINQSFDITQKFHGEILYEGFPIHHAQKSFKAKILCEINFGQMLNPKQTLAKNMQKMAKQYGSECIWDLPLKFLNIHQEHWKTKVKNLDKSTIFQAEWGISMLNTKDVCFLQNISEELLLPHKEKLLGIINAKVTHGNSIIIYTGQNLSLEQEIKIIL